MDEDKTLKRVKRRVRGRKAALWLTAAVTSAGLMGARELGSTTFETDLVKVIHPTSEDYRLGYLRRARVWRPVPTSELDLLAGPSSRRSFAFNEEVTCNYHTPGRELGGATPKFLCEIDGELYKIKYLPEGPSSNREIFAEVAASRLFWALGFGADVNYPIRVVCRGCPRSPHAGPTVEERRRGVYRERTRRLGIALLEQRFDGTPIETSDDEGWTWRELDRYVGTSSESAAAPAGTRTHVEALKLLQVFVQHGDCKPQQQRLVCLPGGLEGASIAEARSRRYDDDEFEEWEGVLEDSTGTHCSDTFALVDDLGATFGGAGDFTRASAKMDLDHWLDKEVFDLDYYEATGRCRGVLNISSSCSGGVENPLISEAGRRFLLERLNQLDDRQIRDLFLASRVDQLDKDMENFEVSLLAWVKGFKEKVRQIGSVTCRDP